MKYLIVILLISNLSFSQEWSKTRLNNLASIEFPNTPDKTNKNGGVYYSTSDDIGVYVVVIKNIGKPEMTESGLPEFYEGVTSGTLAATEGDLLEKSEFQLDGIKGVEISYLANYNPQLPNLRYRRMLVVNNNLISFEFWTFEENEELASKNKDKFFNSIDVSNAKIAELKNPENEEENSAYESGFLIGKVVFYLFIIGLIIGGILLIRKLTNKAKTSGNNV
ncbi:hypothetical protein FHS04_002860 [Mesoflavibacter sabulilitoris]|uniref:Uncharacterized protein n=1 Tax=Mesoflavibacter zeaxanthinifaciens subsp. sabulilitoris TaxID=1520893 RepID=A0A2T1NNE6_9FLAO|nr:hypothetical protein [Mesoflavibacter zeaxanthinifaciens]MBB3125304.1 hypothetical protein [Mesoflavibacter zeaxanthinifaciens subsp. sabulilitoris]MBB3125316.1 hypothetical protein [Mesoflavibacter zeaxanthinifaciens subsp. sabulilitoris]PSG94413.1 hypothetical protein C7H61_01105 [Mesoflavibacter zeaxanthinifaciens subsp. sabulilitoris]PSG94425.1 hypothetical protein C7H61_01165 [Mesoflavibacter zeaxanthinifaciens subsp. sabulilitoris]PSG94426.1 hypothetical protein C7H61_00975 [Mesoflavi